MTDQIKKFFLLVVLTFLCAVAYGQSYIGVKGGGNFSGGYFKPIPRQSFSNGIEGGLVFRIMNTNTVGIQAELLYVQKAISLFQNEAQAYSEQIGYIELPVSTFLQFGKGKLKFNLSGGVFVGRAVTDLEFPERVSEPIIVDYYGQKQQLWHYGLQGGGGPSFSFGKQVIQLDFRYSQNLSNFLEVDLSNEKDFDISQHQVMSLNLIWLYNISVTKK